MQSETIVKLRITQISDSWITNQSWITHESSTRFVGKPEGVSNVFLTILTIFSGEGVNINLGGRDAPEGVEPPTNLALHESHSIRSNAHGWLMNQSWALTIESTATIEPMN